MGRPTKYTTMRGDDILELLEAGLSRSEAAARTGVGLRTLAEWLARGRAGDPTLRLWARRFDLLAERRRRARVERNFELENVRSRERWAAFKASRERRWLERLGPAEFWCRRLEWLLDRGHIEAFRREAARLRAEGFRINRTP